jgi:dienelactone hydrolase
MDQPAANQPSRRQPLRWWPIAAAGVAAVTALFCIVVSWSSMWDAHPAYWVTLLAVVLGASGVAAWAWWNSPATPRKPFRTWSLRFVLVVATLSTTAFIVYVRPLGADQIAIDAMRNGAGVTVADSSSEIRLQPDDPKATGLVFYPGAKVDPRAYVRILRPVAEAGFSVVIVKFPYNLAVFGIRAANDVIGRDDGVDHWVIGGHSLGGAMAATFATDPHRELDGLLLYAAFPAGSLAAQTQLDVTSVYGTEDGLATVAKIEASKADLPDATHFVPIEGGIHAFFGDYGSQRGDGTPTIGRDEAQAQIVAATLEQLDRVDHGG